MSNTWKIGLPDAPYSECTLLSSLGASNLRRSLRANGPDEFSFTISSALALTADLDLSYKTRYTIWKDESTRWFSGIVTSLPRSADPASEQIHVQLTGPWWHLENCMYQQVWKIYDETEESVIEQAKARVILFQTLLGAKINSGPQVQDAIDWAIARGAPIQVGVIDSGAELPFDEQINISCAQVIHTVLRWFPDNIAWFDYSTEPPTFNFRARSNLSPVTKALTALSALNITPRYDLQKPGVQLIFERTDTIDDVAYSLHTVDAAGDTDAIDCVHAVFDLAGGSLSYLKQKIEVSALPTDEWTQEQLVAWLKAHVPCLDHARITDINVQGFEFVPASSLTNELTEGQIHDWMQEDPSPLSAPESIAVRVTYDRILRDAAAVAIDVAFDAVVDVQVIATDATSKTYKALASWDSGEAVPTGLAAALFSSWSILHHDGAAALTEDECTASVTPATPLNISGGRTEWATMNALVQEITEDLDAGITQLRFGPPAALEADSLVALFRALRGRRYAYRRQDRTDGQSSGAADVALSGPVPKEVPAGFAGQRANLVIEDDVTE